MNYAYFIGNPDDVNKGPSQLKRIRPEDKRTLKIPVDFTKTGIKPTYFVNNDFETVPAGLNIESAKIINGDWVSEFVPKDGSSITLSEGEEFYEVSIVHNTIDGGERLFKAYRFDHPEFKKRLNKFLDSHVYTLVGDRSNRDIEPREAMKVAQLDEWKFSLKNESDLMPKAIISYGKEEHPDRKYVVINDLQKRRWLVERQTGLGMRVSFTPEKTAQVYLKPGNSPSIHSIKFGDDFEKCSFDALHVYFSYPNINNGYASEMRILNRDFYDATRNSDKMEKISEAVGL